MAIYVFNPTGVTMKKSAIVLSLAALVGSTASNAQSEMQIVSSKVLNRTPIMESIQVSSPKRVCYQEQVVTQNTQSYTPSILGGIVGAAAGNQFGKGRGKDLATVAGGVLGASVGRDVQNKNAQSHTALVERCHDEVEYRYEERVTGWRVTYEYNGQTYVTRTDSDPGENLKLRVSVQPI